MKVWGKVNFDNESIRELLLGNSEQILSHDKPWNMAYDSLYKRASMIDRIPLADSNDSDSDKRITIIIAPHNGNKEEINIFFEFNSSDIKSKNIDELDHDLLHSFRSSVMELLEDYKNSVSDFTIKNICMIDQSYNAKTEHDPAKTFDRVYWTYKSHHLFSIHASMFGFFGKYELIQEYNAPTAKRIIEVINENEACNFENGETPIYNGIIKIAIKMIASYIAVVNNMQCIDTYLSEENISK